MAKRSPIFRNSDVGVNSERVAPAHAARRIALDLQEVIHQLDVSLLRVKERGPRQAVICFKFDDFASVFYRGSDVGLVAKKRAWERWKRDVRLHAPNVELRGATPDKADFCINVTVARSWSDDVMGAAGITEPDEGVRSRRPSREDEDEEPEPETEPLPPDPVPRHVEVRDPTSEEVDQRASACVERCRSSAKAALRRGAERAAQREADRMEREADLSRHRFRSARGGGRPSRDEPCAVCSKPWHVHPITLAVPGVRR